MLLASRWNVDSAITATTIDHFYAALLSGNSVAESLHGSASEVRKDPKTAHPYYWRLLARLD